MSATTSTTLGQCDYCGKAQHVPLCCCLIEPSVFPSMWYHGKHLYMCGRFRNNESTHSLQICLFNDTKFTAGSRLTIDMSAAAKIPHYNFECEWQRGSFLIHLVNPTSGGSCPGVTNSLFHSLFAMQTPGGIPSLATLNEAFASHKFPLLHRLWKHSSFGQTFSHKAFCETHGVFSYFSQLENIRSAFCSHTIGCRACLQLSQDSALRKRANRHAAADLDLDTSHTVQVCIMSGVPCDMMH